MSRHRRFILLIGGFLLVLYAILIFSRGHEPTYKGRFLRTWLMELSSVDRDQSSAAAAAIRHIGTNAIPHLLKWIAYETPNPNSSWIDRINKPIAWLHDKVNATSDWSIEDHDEYRASAAASAFSLLGADAGAAVPALTRLLNETGHTSAAWNVAGALARIGQPGLPPLKAALEGTNADLRAIVLHNISLLGTNAQSLIPLLIHFLVTGDDDLKPVHFGLEVGLEAVAAKVLGQLAIEPAIVIPVLITALGSTNIETSYCAALALAHYGPAARPAIPVLTELLTVAGPDFRNTITNVLNDIDPLTFTNTVQQTR